MEPTIRDGEKLKIDSDAFRNALPQRGDIVLHEHDGVKYVRRVVGLPGELITINGGAVYVNGNKLDEPYLAAGTRTGSAMTDFDVPEISYFLMGDNREHAQDSRAIGFIPLSQITAKVVR